MTLHSLYTQHVTWLYIHFTHNISHDSTSTLHTMCKVGMESWNVTTYHMTLYPLYTPFITWLYIHFTHHLSQNSISTLQTVYHMILHPCSHSESHDPSYPSVHLIPYGTWHYDTVPTLHITACISWPNAHTYNIYYNNLLMTSTHDKKLQPNKMFNV